jgi:hypothetical protein
MVSPGRIAYRIDNETCIVVVVVIYVIVNDVESKTTTIHSYSQVMND